MINNSGAKKIINFVLFKKQLGLLVIIIWPLVDILRVLKKLKKVMYFPENERILTQLGIFSLEFSQFSTWTTVVEGLPKYFSDKDLEEQALQILKEVCDNKCFLRVFPYRHVKSSIMLIRGAISIYLSIYPRLVLW